MANNCDNCITIKASAKIRRLIRKHAERDTLLEFMLPGEAEDRSKRFGTRWVAEFQFLEVEAGFISFVCFSASTPPLEALKRFSARKGVHSIKALYFEPGNAFAGMARAKRGNLSDNCMDCDSSNWECIPSEIKDAFCLESFYADSEDDSDSD